MPSFSNIGLQEPSTITARVAAVTVSRGSTAEQQEILVLGDSESSLGIARVRDAAPNSTDWGLVTRQVGYVAPSTTVNVSSVGGVVNVAQNSTVWAVQAAQAGTWSVTVSNPASTTVNVSSLGGTVSVAQASTTWAVQQTNYSTIAAISSVAGKVAVVNSSAADLNVTVAGYSTTVNVSSLAGVVRVAQSSAADLNVTVAGYSTTANVSSLAGRVGIAGFHGVAGIVNVTDSTNTALRVNVVAGSAAGSTVTTVSQLLDSSGGSVTVGDSANQALRVNVVAGAAGGSTVATISRVQDSSNNGIAVGDSANNAIRVNVVAGAAGGSTVVTVSTGSVRVHQSTAADLQATVAQTSTVWAVQAAQAGSWSVTVSNPASTTVNVSSVSGVVTVQQNSTTWAVQQTNYSTTANVSSLAGRVLVDQNSTAWVVQVSSVAGELIARIDDGAGNPLESSTLVPSSNARGLVVRPVIAIPATYSASTAGQSSATTIFSSNATVRPYVFAYSITSTLAGPVNWSIQKGSTRMWGGVLAAVSSAISGANLAVSPPGFLFAGSTGRPLSFNVESSNTGVNVSIAYWQCP